MEMAVVFLMYRAAFFSPFPQPGMKLASSLMLIYRASTPSSYPSGYPHLFKYLLYQESQYTTLNSNSYTTKDVFKPKSMYTTLKLVLYPSSIQFYIHENTKLHGLL